MVQWSLLEEYVRSLLSSLMAEKRITPWSACVRASGKQIFNELDALFTVNNRLHFIECKTGKVDSAPVYTSFSLRENLGGSFAKSLICSVARLSEGDARRAAEYKIKTVTGPQLKNLRTHILEWINRKD